MTKSIVQCGICAGRHHAMRNHCPFCGAQRIFLATHSFEAPATEIKHRNSEHPEREVVRAFRSDLAFSFITQ